MKSDFSNIHNIFRHNLKLYIFIAMTCKLVKRVGKWKYVVLNHIMIIGASNLEVHVCLDSDIFMGLFDLLL